MHEVVLMEPEDENYRGVSVSNYFEVFVTRIKDQFLPDVGPDKIKWFNHIRLYNPEFILRTLILDLEWKNEKCINAEWNGDMI
ncbi:MAG: hypothetical protein A2X86_09240 [Bdellovibrionales bacterium GWA2_49_15]|nr:MAG: hypothetical protein A2X86_09240 [Bdellovibrionales bacterium GWA2_49_15]HAZ12962.1 hypothetical protein [Bdellovibrionales bacterium]